MKNPILRLTVISILLLIVFSSVSAQQPPSTISWTKVADSEIESVDFSPDGSSIVFVDRSSDTLRVLDWRTGVIAWQAPEARVPDAGVYSLLAWSPSNNLIGQISKDGSLALYEASAGERVMPIESLLNNIRRVLIELTYNGIVIDDDIGEFAGFSDLQWNGNGTELAVMTRSYIVIYDVTNDEIKDVIDLLVVPSTNHGNLSTFAWSPDNERFAAYHFRLSDGREAFPLELSIGFWRNDGRWLYEYENARSQACVLNGQELARLNMPGLMGGRYEWSPDGTSLALVENVLTLDQRLVSICALGSNGSLTVKRISDFAPVDIQWSSDGKELMALANDCSVHWISIEDMEMTHTIPFNDSCRLISAAWSVDEQYIALGTQDGLWVGEIK